MFRQIQTTIFSPLWGFELAIEPVFTNILAPPGLAIIFSEQSYKHLRPSGALNRLLSLFLQTFSPPDFIGTGSPGYLNNYLFQDFGSISAA